MHPGRALQVLLLALLPLAGTGCVKKMAVGAMADTLSGETGGAFTQDDDIEFVGEAIPFALKLMESIAAEAPDHVGIRESLCSGFTQYTAVYVQWPAQQVRYDDFEAYQAGLARSRGFYRRAQADCFSAWELKYPGFEAHVMRDPQAALAQTTADDVPLLYWTSAAWLSRISISKEDMEAIGELPIAAAMVERALELDPDWSAGALHDLSILLEPSLPMPGGLDRAREHYERAVELADGTRASPHVSLGTSVAVVEQDKERFVELMEKALAVDPDADPEAQLANLYAQEQARYYLSHLDDLFVE